MPAPRPSGRTSSACSRRASGRARHRRGQRRGRDGQPDDQRAHHRPRQPGRDQLGDRAELRERLRHCAGGYGGEQPARRRRGANRATASAPRARARERQNFEVSETRRERVILPGAIRRISVAVMVDGLVAAGADGTEVWSPRPPEEMETLRQLVRSAIGFDKARGDTVTIESLEFTPFPEQGSLADRSGPGFLAHPRRRLAQLGVLGPIVLALIFFVLRPMTARRPVLELAELTGPREFGDLRRRDPAAADRPRRPPRPAGADRGQDRAAARRHRQPRRGQRRGAQQLDRVPRGPQGASRIMSAYRLETFPAGRGARAARRRRSSAALETRPRAGLTEGFLDGQAMATEGFPREQGRLTTELVEAIADAELTNEAARRHVAATLAPPSRRWPGRSPRPWPTRASGPRSRRRIERALIPGPGRAAASPRRARGRRAASGRLLAEPRLRRRHRRGAGAPAARGADLPGRGLRPSRSRRLHRADPRLYRVASQPA